jgi:superfamily I DNA/RNA helicase|tara:strand:+ start:78 stop:443 length:366 start_codon:yes stop_codon:yes gene_type:complete
MIIHKVDPKSILVTTFTDKAANELKVKLARTIGKKAELMHISTIHSFCKSMLEKYFLHHQYGAEINVLDEESQKLVLQINKVNLGLAYWKDGKMKINTALAYFVIPKDIIPEDVYGPMGVC